MNTNFANFVMTFPGHLVMPIGIYPGTGLIHATVRKTITDAYVQSEAALAMHERFHTPILQTAMDLSVEAEAFGCTICMEDFDLPKVVGRRISSLGEIKALTCPDPGDHRTRVYLDAAYRLVRHAGDRPVLGGLIGPFSLASRLFGVHEILLASSLDPDLVLALIEKETSFLMDYAQEYKRAGTSGVLMAEPSAGLLSPRALAKFSSPFIKRIIDEVQTKTFTIILHSCSATLAHLSGILETEAELYHFGAPMEIISALDQVDGRGILCGNLDPVADFLNSRSTDLVEKASRIIAGVAGRKNFILSSGCDLLTNTPVENLDAFYSIRVL